MRICTDILFQKFGEKLRYSPSEPLTGILTGFVGTTVLIACL